MPKNRREGYLLIDHTFSPGVPEGFAKSAGFDVPDVAGGMMYESAVVTCLHCNSNIILNPDRKRPRGYCAKCDGYICDKSQCQECKPHVKTMEKLQDFLGDHCHIFQNGYCLGCGELEEGWIERHVAKIHGKIHSGPLY